MQMCLDLSSETSDQAIIDKIVKLFEENKKIKKLNKKLKSEIKKLKSDYKIEEW
jgi:cell division protein FtsB